jgi:hypothetical protein
MSTTKMTGGATAGTTSSTTTKKALWWVVLAIVGFIALIWVVSTLKSEEFRLMWGRMWKSPHDFVQGPGGAYYPRGEEPQSIAERAMKNNLSVAGRFYDPRSTIVLDKDWQGVVNTNAFKKVVTHYANNDVYVEIRLDADDKRISPIPPCNWTEPTTLKLGDAEIIEWRIRSDQNGPASVINNLVDK